MVSRECVQVLSVPDVITCHGVYNQASLTEKKLRDQASLLCSDTRQLKQYIRGASWLSSAGVRCCFVQVWAFSSSPSLLAAWHQVPLIRKLKSRELQWFLLLPLARSHLHGTWCSCPDTGRASVVSKAFHMTQGVENTWCRIFRNCQLSALLPHFNFFFFFRPT